MLHLSWSHTLPESLTPRRAAEIRDQEFTRALHEIAAEFERRVRIGTPVGVGGDGGLRGSIAGEVRGVPAREAVIGTPLAYGVVVERGRRPGQAMPPIAPLELWVRRKLGVPDEQAHAVAIAVAWKIRRRGFPGAFMFRNALRTGGGTLQVLWSAVATRIARRLGGYPMG